MTSMTRHSRRPLETAPSVARRRPAILVGSDDSSSGLARRRRLSRSSSGCLLGFLDWGVERVRVVIVVWWLFFSRAPWSERIGRHRPDDRRAVRGVSIVHESIAGGMMGMMFLSTPFRC